jgi:DNA polymerase III sliding clamp (beta) subunit (PCNA family)
MKAIFAKTELLKAVNKIGKIAFYYKNNELYNNLKIDCNGSIVFRINNDIAFLKTTVEGEVQKQGSVCVNSCDFVGIVNSINSEIIQIELINSRLYIRGNEYLEVCLSILANESFITGPNLSDFKKKQSLTIDSDILKDAFANCLPFENSKSLIQGVNFKTDKNKNLCVCCCSELSACLYYINNLAPEQDWDVDFTLDTRFLKDFKDIFDNEGIQLAVYDRFLNLKTNNTELTLRFLNKKFPLVEKILQIPFNKELPIVKSAFEQAFSLIDIITKNIDAAITYKNRQCIIKHGEEVNVSVNIDSDVIEDIRIEREQLRKVFRLIDKDRLTASFAGTSKPLMIKENNKIFLISVLVK